jgi:hypothetical protein
MSQERKKIIVSDYKEEPIIEALTNEIEKSQKTEIGYTYIDTLPTEYKLYPKGTKITARSLKVREIKALSSMTEENANDIINSVLSSCIRGIEIDNIYAADKLYLIFWLRANTFADSSYKVNFECSKCKKHSTYGFTLDQLMIKSLSDTEYEKDNQLVLTNGDIIKFKLLTIKDENDNIEFLEKNKNNMAEFDMEFLTICRMIESVNDKQKGMIEKYLYITEEITAIDYTKIDSKIKKLSIGLEPTITVKCDKCGGMSETLIPFRPDFFLPTVGS